MPDLPPDTRPAPQRTSALRVRWATALMCAVVALTGLCATAWWWAGTEGSLAWVVSHAARWLSASSLPEMQQVTGSLRHGGTAGELRWSSKPTSSSDTPMVVRASGVVFRWQPWALWRGQLMVDELTAQSVHVTLPHSEAPGTPLQSLTLPVGVKVAFAVQQVAVEGAAPLQIKGLSGHYTYDHTEARNAQHVLKLDRVGVAAGDYALDATLQAEAPMALQATLSGQVQTALKAQARQGGAWTVQAQAQVKGTLSGDGATLKVDAQLKPAAGHQARSGVSPEPSPSPSGGPELDLSATVRPWALQQWPQVHATFVRLNLADVWPQAPQTVLSGAIVATPEGPTGLEGQADVTLGNALPGPIDRQRLPLQQIKAQLRVRAGQWTVSNASAQLGGGTLQGQGRWQATAQGGQTAWAGDLTLEQVNLSALHTAMAPVQVDGRLKASDHSPEKSAHNVSTTAFELVLKPSAGRLAVPQQLRGLALRELVVQGEAQADLWRLHTVRVDAAQAQLTAQGEVNTRQRSFKGQAKGRVPGAVVTLDGQVQLPSTSAWPQGAGELRVKLNQADVAWAWLKGLPLLPGLDAHVRGWDVRGQADLVAQWPSNATGAGGSFQLSVPQAQLQAPQEGTASRPDPMRLSQWQVSANGPGSAVAVQAQGVWEQALMRGRLDTQAVISLGDDAAFGQRGRATVSRFEAQLEDQARQVAVRLASSPASPWVGHWANGAMEVEAGALTVTPQDRPAYPAPKGETVTLAWRQLRWDEQGLRTQGTLSPFSLAWVDWLAGPGSQPLADLGVGGALRFEGDWDVHWPRDANTPVRLNAGLQRRSGDLRLGVDDGLGGGVQHVPAGLRDASVRVVAQSQPGKPGVRLQSQLRWVSDRAGTVSAQASTDLQVVSGAWSWPAEAAVQGTLDARLPQIGAWSLLAPPGWRMQGTLAAQATLSGSRRAPLWHGELQADQLALRSVVNGIEFLNGQLRATLAGDKVVIERFALEGAGGAKVGGQLQATGSAQWVLDPGNTTVRRRVPRIDMQVAAERLRVSSRADQRLVVSGQAQAQLMGAQLQLRGKLRADQAAITLPDELTPSLGDDVVVRGRQAPMAAVPVGQVVPDVLLDLDLGNQFAVQGHGLKARLEGTLQVRSTREQPVPRVQGEVRSTSGTYRAYGVNLKVETGVLRFAGPYDNPSLDILAIRPNITQRVGVQVTGTAQVPNVRLYAEPELPDAEKLSWLVLGRSASGPGGEAAILQQAAMSLLGKPGNGLQGGLASSLGLDDLSYRSGGVNADGTVSSAAVSLGKRLSSRLYLVYGQSLTSSVGTVSILYELSRRLTLRARAGEDNTLDVIFTQRYD